MFIVGARPFGQVLRTAAAAFIVAAAVASCTSGGTSGRASGGTASSTSGETSRISELIEQVEAVSASPSEPTANSRIATTATPASPAPTSEADTASAASTNAAATAILDTAPTRDMVNDGIVDSVEIEAANPVTIRIPSIEVEAPIIGLGLRDDGAIEIPAKTDETGWWRGGPEPGERGPAVILGHVDSWVGPAVFFRLRELKAGDEVYIDREDGTTVTYIVESSESHGKDTFPTDAVYGATEQPTLRLVTCGGDFDFNERSYLDNLIVFASIA